MTRDEFAQQFIEGAMKRGKTKEEIAPVLQTALADFDKQNPQSEGLLQGILKSKAIPITGSILGGGIGALAGPLTGIAGVGAGYAGADAARKSLLSLLDIQGGQPTNPAENVIDTAKPAAIASATQGAMVGAGKLLPFLNPFKTVGKLRNYAFKGAEIPGQTITEGAANIAKNAPVQFRNDVLELAKLEGEKNIGKTLDATQALKDAAAQGDVGFAARSGLQIRGSDAYYAREMEKFIKEQLRGQGKKLGNVNLGKAADQLFSVLYGAKKELGGAVRRVLPFGVLGKMISGGY